MVKHSWIAGLTLIGLAIAPMAHAASAVVTAVHATDRETSSKSYDDTSRGFEELLESVEFDTFKTVKRQSVTLAPGQDLDIPINSRYTLAMKDTELQSDGHVKSLIQVFGLPRNASEPVKVLEMNVRLAPGKPVMIRGLRMDEGEIIAFIQMD